MEQACKVGIRKIMDNAKNLRIASSVQCATRNQKKKIKEKTNHKKISAENDVKVREIRLFLKGFIEHGFIEF